MLCYYILIAPANASQHLPINITWILFNADTGTIVCSISKVAPLNTWFPYFKTGVCGGKWQAFDWERTYGCGWRDDHMHLNRYPFYVCLGSRQSQAQANKCIGSHHHYSAQWDCESTRTIPWDPPIKNDLIAVTRILGGGPCLPLTCNTLLI